MVGQGSPSAWKVSHSRCALAPIGPVMLRLYLTGIVIALCAFGITGESSAAEKTVRLRLAWGSGNASKQRWTGEIAVEGGVFTQLQPLGIEPDAPVALRIDGSQIVVDPLERRVFDGCDVTIRADEQARVQIRLRSEQLPQAVAIESTMAEIATNQLQQPLDELGSFFLAHRSPGDQLRVLPTREHFVFGPGETWNLKLQPDLAAELQLSTVVLDVQLRAVGETKSSWRSSQKISDAAQLQQNIDFEIPCPTIEGAYRLTVTARPEEGFATRFVPGQQSKPIATRDVEFVVIDPAARLPRLVDDWQAVLTIDPANPRWWQRLPAWAQVPKLRERTSGAIGNVRPVIRPMATGDLVELPPAAEGDEPYWQSYTLPIREPGKPHLVEIEYPLGVAQHLAICLIEPDAAGRVTATQQDASLFSIAHSAAEDGEVDVHRFLIWPRTTAPQLLLANQHPSQPGQFGKIRLLKQAAELETLSEAPVFSSEERLVATYLSKPVLANSFGAAEVIDVGSGLSVHSWSTFLEATQRLAQTLRLRGYNGIMLSVAADGSALFPSQVIRPSPRYDTGLLAASGQDPRRKDVLEMLLRVFDREGLRVVPTVQFSTPLHRLEALRLAGDSRKTGIECLGYNGQNWLSGHPTNNGAAPFYNPLNNRVQTELIELVAELTNRYGSHQALAGVAVQVSGEGYGMLPGIASGMDDNTIAAFTRSTGIAVPGQGNDRFRHRASFLLGEHRNVWRDWRAAELTNFYSKLGQQVSMARSDLQLILATEDAFSGPELQQRVRKAIADAGQLNAILLDHGINLVSLNTNPAITTTLPHRIAATDRLQQRAIDLRVNTAVVEGELLPTAQCPAGLLFQTASQQRLPSFDELSPFGSEQSNFTLTSQPHATGADGRQELVRALATQDATTLVMGGELLATNVEPHTRRVIRTLQRLPLVPVEVQTQRQQPVVARTYRTERATIVALVNESPWPVQSAVALSCANGCGWSKLGADDPQTDQFDDTITNRGTLDPSEPMWQVELQPYDLQAWRFEDPQLQVGELQTTMSDLAKQELELRIREIESRTGNLNIERPYAQLQNPGFELEDGGLRIVGWQPRQGSRGSIGLDNRAARSGKRALRLTSEDAVGVAVQSHLFPSPETGQLLVSAYLRVGQLEEDALLRISVQGQEEGRRYRQAAQLGRQQLVSKDWSLYEFALADVPLDGSEQLRLQFHLTGQAELQIDDVQLYDLHFDDSRRRSLVKRIYTAKLALERGQVVDCLSMLDDYWSQYMVEYVPPAEPVALQATKISPVTESEQQEEAQGIRSRLRGWVPSFWR